MVVWTITEEEEEDWIRSLRPYLGMPCRYSTQCFLLWSCWWTCPGRPRSKPPLTACRTRMSRYRRTIAPTLPTGFCCLWSQKLNTVLQNSPVLKILHRGRLVHWFNFINGIHGSWKEWQYSIFVWTRLHFRKSIVLQSFTRFSKSECNESCLLYNASAFNFVLQRWNIFSIIQDTDFC